MLWAEAHREGVMKAFALLLAASIMLAGPARAEQAEQYNNDTHWIRPRLATLEAKMAARRARPSPSALT
jgi:hypothetical protein